MSQKVLQYIEIDIDYCSLSYGASPCQARTTSAVPSSAVKLLLHFDGFNGSTLFVDSSLSAHGNATVGGSAQIISPGALFGLGCGYFDPASFSYLAYGTSADWELGSGDFTIEWWEYRYDATDGRPVMCRDIGNAAFQAFLCGYAVSGQTRFYASSNGSSWDVVNAMSLGPVAVNTWTHRAVVRGGNNFYGFMNGVLQGTATSSASLFPCSNSNAIGIYTSGGVPFNFYGLLDELRFSKGLARWTSNFDPNVGLDLLATGSIKCFNTLVTCQDRPHFTDAPVTLRFAVPTNYLPKEIDCIPSIKDISFDPAVISLGEDLGQRATLTVSFDDHRHSDSGFGFDKYLADRTYDPYSQGTFWGKFRARQPYLRGRNLRWINGFLGDALADMETRHYIIDSFSGPDNNGKFQIIAKDLLKLADGDRAMAPLVSNGYLNSALTSSSTSFTLIPFGIGDLEYPANFYANLGGSEIVICSRSGDSVTIGARGLFNTAAQAHSAQDRVQVVLYYNATSPDLIIADLLINYAGVDGSFIPSSDWSTEVNSYLNRLYTTVVAQPTSVNTLISELIEQAGLSMWWDDRNQQIGLLVLRGLNYSTYLFSEDSVIADSFEVTEQPDKRLSQVHTYFGQINPCTSLTDKANYRSVSKKINTQAESDYGSPAIKEVFSRWIPALGRTIADRLGSILLARFTDPPRHIKVSVLRNSTPEIQLARGYQVTSKFLQDVTGASAAANVQVTRLQPSADVIQVEADEVIYTAAAEDLTTRFIIIDSDSNNLILRTVHDQIYPTPVAGITVICIVNPGIRVYSGAQSVPSLDIGSWPAGVTIILSVDGGIRGAGGRGGNYNADTALDGGTALYTRVPIKLACTGTIYGGGGGGGGTAYGGQASGSNLPSAGGGGAGVVPGGGGIGAAMASPGTEFAGGAASGPFVYGGSGGNVGAPGASGFSGVVAGVFYQGQPGHRGGYWCDGFTGFVTTGSLSGTTFTPGALGGSQAGSIT
jgi:hypothetical protein